MFGVDERCDAFPVSRTGRAAGYACAARRLARRPRRPCAAGTGRSEREHRSSKTQRIREGARCGRGGLTSRPSFCRVTTQVPARCGRAPEQLRFWFQPDSSARCIILAPYVEHLFGCTSQVLQTRGSAGSPVGWPHRKQSSARERKQRNLTSKRNGARSGRSGHASRRTFFFAFLLFRCSL